MPALKKNDRRDAAGAGKKKTECGLGGDLDGVGGRL
jgi:hypothetical protein